MENIHGGHNHRNHDEFIFIFVVIRLVLLAAYLYFEVIEKYPLHTYM